MKIQSIVLGLILTSCSTFNNPVRKLASEPVKTITAADVQCYREIRKKANLDSGFVSGFDGPITMSLGEVWTERYGTSDEYDPVTHKAIVQWYAQYGVQMGIIAEDSSLWQITLPPYSTAGFMKNCPDSDGHSINTIELQGRRFVAVEGVSGFDTFLAPGATLPDACAAKETRRQNLQYKGWEKDILNHSKTLIQVDLDGKEPVLKAVPLDNDQNANVAKELTSGAEQYLKSVFRSYDLKVQYQKGIWMRDRGPPTFAEDSPAPDTGSFMSQLEFKSCAQAPLIGKLVQDWRDSIKNCSDHYSERYENCSR